MAQITIEVPDEFAQRLEPFRGQLPELFARFLSAALPGKSVESAPLAGSDTTSGTYQEILDFLVSQPTSQQIVDFKVSESAQIRLRTLLQRSRDSSMDTKEKEELDLYEQLDTLIGLLKVKAFTAARLISEG